MQTPVRWSQRKQLALHVHMHALVLRVGTPTPDACASFLLSALFLLARAHVSPHNTQHPSTPTPNPQHPCHHPNTQPSTPSTHYPTPNTQDTTPGQHSTLNTQHPSSNTQHPNIPNPQHPTLNTQHPTPKSPTPNTQHPTPNTTPNPEHPTHNHPNTQHPTPPTLRLSTVLATVVSHAEPVALHMQPASQQQPAVSTSVSRIRIQQLVAGCQVLELAASASLLCQCLLRVGNSQVFAWRRFRLKRHVIRDSQDMLS